MNFLKAILMTVAFLVIMVNSPPAKSNASVNAGTAKSSAAVNVKAAISAQITSTNQTMVFPVLGVADIKKGFSSSVALTANIITVSTEKSNMNVLNRDAAFINPKHFTTELRDDTSHILKCPLTLAFSAALSLVDFTG